MALKLLVVGGGRMGTAFLGGLVAHKWAEASELGVVEPLRERRAELARRLPGLAVMEVPPLGVATAGSHTGSRAEVRTAGDAGGTEGDALLAVKPDAARAACEALRAAGVLRVLSIVAGVRIETLEDALGPASVVLRAMPNTPAIVGAAASALSAGRRATRADEDWAESVLSAIGTVVRVREADLDAVTGLSGSGPAYLFALAEALVDAGVHVGLTPSVSRDLVVQTLLGSAKLLAESREDARVLRESVTSPGGTTAAAMTVLEESGTHAAYVRAIAAATERSRALGA